MTVRGEVAVLTARVATVPQGSSRPSLLAGRQFETGAKGRLAMDEQNAWPDDGVRQALALRRGEAHEARTIVDVGAHYGETLQSVLSIANEPLTYLALEPHPDSFARLEDTGAALACDGLRFESLAAAAGPASGSATFYRTKESAVSGMLRPAEGLAERVPTGDHRIVQELAVKVVTVDEVLAARGIASVDLLKVDAEGYDLDVLTGAADSLSSGAIGVVLSEVFFVTYREGQSYFWEIAAYLGGHGYYFVNLFDTRETEQGRLYTGNGLWVSQAVARANNYL